MTILQFIKRFFSPILFFFSSVKTIFKGLSSIFSSIFSLFTPSNTTKPAPASDFKFSGKGAKRSYSQQDLYEEKCRVENNDNVVNKMVKIVKEKSLQLKLNTKKMASISKPVQDLLKTYYLKPMNDGSEKMGEIQRKTHGASHAARVMLLTDHLINAIPEARTAIKHIDYNRIIRKKGKSVKKPTIEPTQYNVVLLAALLHDSGRQGGGTDHWDHLSGANLTYQLVEKMGLSPELAIIFGKFAEHKDHPQWAINEIKSGKLIDDKNWRTKRYPYRNTHLKYVKNADKEKMKAYLKNPKFVKTCKTISLLISLSDCLDIQRCTPSLRESNLNTGLRKLESTLEMPKGSLQKQHSKELIELAKALEENTFDHYSQKKYSNESVQQQTYKR